LLLNEESMSVMLDNQLMTFKYQVMSASSLYEVTMNHLQEMFKIAELAGNQAVLASLVDLKARFETVFSALSIGDAADLRMRILAFLQDKRYEARMMLEDGKMADDYGINYKMNCSEGMPAHSEKPGMIRFYDNKGANWNSTPFDPMKVSHGSYPPPEDFFVSVPADPPLGCDMFSAFEPDMSDLMSPMTPSISEDQDPLKSPTEAAGETGTPAVVPGGDQSSVFFGGAGEDGFGDDQPDELDLMLARNNSAVVAAMQSLATVMSNLPTAKVPGPKYDPHNPDGDGSRSGKKSSASSTSEKKKKDESQDDLLGMLDQLASVSEQPTQESLMSALSDLSTGDGGGAGTDAETLEAMSILNSAAQQPTKAELNAALSDLSGLMPSSSDVDDALASLDSIAASSGSSDAKPPSISADELGAALLAVESHPDQADVDALNMLDSVAHSKLDSGQSQTLDQDALSSALEGLSGFGGDGSIDTSSVDLDGTSFSSVLAQLDQGGVGELPHDLVDKDLSQIGDVDDVTLPESPSFVNPTPVTTKGTETSSSSKAPQSFLFDLSGLEDLMPKSDGSHMANSAVFDISDLKADF